jgi:hypothetical protein
MNSIAEWVAENNQIFGHSGAAIFVRQGRLNRQDAKNAKYGIKHVCFSNLLFRRKSST